MKALVTGATGFLGGALARRLAADGHEVTVFGRNPEALAQLESQGMVVVRGDLADAGLVSRACRGQQVVFHVGALSSAWGKESAFHASNVVGTRNVLSGCRAAAVERLVYVSTPSVYGLPAPSLAISEACPFTDRPPNAYVRTKILAEREVAAASAQGLPVVVLRPRAVFGEGDNALFPRLLQRLEAGTLRIVGDGLALTDLTYVDNAVDALLAAANTRLGIGKAYNITNGEPVLLWPLVARLAQELGLRPPTVHVPAAVAYAAAAVFEGVFRLLPGRPEPPLTRYMVNVLSQSITLDIGAAGRDLGYTPRVSLEDGLKRFLHSYREARP